MAPIYGKFYPSQYYTYANAPIIKVMLSPIAGVETFLKYNLSISNSNFTNNKHIQLLGGKQYYGSLLHYETTYTNGSKFFPSVNIANTAFRDNKFLGNQTSLVYIHQAYINFTNNTVTGNGFLSNNITRKSASASIKADGYTFYLSQHYGFLRMINTEQFSATTANLIRDNKFSFNFAQQGAAIYMYLQGQFVSLDNNLYRYNFAQTGPALSVQTSDTQRSTI